MYDIEDIINIYAIPYIKVSKEIIIKNEEFDKINLPSKVITGTNFETSGYIIYSDTGRTSIGVIPDGTTAGEILSNLEISSEDYYTGILDSKGNRLAKDDRIVFSDMLGIYRNEDDTLIGTIDIETETEKGINHLKHK